MDNHVQPNANVSHFGASHQRNPFLPPHKLHRPNSVVEPLAQTMPAISTAKLRHRAATSVLNFLAAFQMKEDSQMAKLLPQLNAKCMVSRPVQMFRLQAEQTAVKGLKRFRDLEKSQIDHLTNLTSAFDAMSSNAQDGPLGIKDFLFRSKGPTHVLITPNHLQVAKAIRTYQAFKKRKPELTAVFVVP